MEVDFTQVIGISGTICVTLCGGLSFVFKQLLSSMGKRIDTLDKDLRDCTAKHEDQNQKNLELAKVASKLEGKLEALQAFNPTSLALAIAENIKTLLDERR